MIAEGKMVEALQVIGQIAFKRQDATMTLTFENGELTHWEGSTVDTVFVDRPVKLDMPRRRTRNK